jgi:hypothetical protein
MFRGIESIRQSRADLRFQALESMPRRIPAASPGRFGLPTLLRSSLIAAQIFLISVCANSIASTTVSSFDFFRARLDHDNRIGGAYDHDVEQAVAHFGVSGIGDKTAVDQPTRTAPSGPRNGISERSAQPKRR